ncbi:MAG: hypothetical protein HN909_03770 [Phycisphaerales bacterium]|jgi:hypothetical protein|nr:hypothetical protein [Phycisphaerales bacterium]MBT7170870.1 hypothetical protein [Phycisphaerales bacterium]
MAAYGIILWALAGVWFLFGESVRDNPRISFVVYNLLKYLVPIGALALLAGGGWCLYQGLVVEME